MSDSEEENATKASEEKENESQYYSFMALAISFFVIGISVETVRIPFWAVSVAFAAISYSYYQKSSNKDENQMKDE